MYQQQNLVAATGPWFLCSSDQQAFIILIALKRCMCVWGGICWLSLCFPQKFSLKIKILRSPHRPPWTQLARPRPALTCGPAQAPSWPSPCPGLQDKPLLTEGFGLPQGLGPAHTRERSLLLWL